MALALMLLWGGTARAQVTVTVYLTDNSTEAVEVDASGQITFTEDDLTVLESTLTGTTTSWDIDDISKVTFDGDVNTEGIGNITSGSLSLFPNPARESLTINGIGNTPSMVTVFNTTGVIMIQQMCSDGTVLDVSRLEKGLYFVRIGQQTLKLAKQ